MELRRYSDAYTRWLSEESLCTYQIPKPYLLPPVSFMCMIVLSFVNFSSISLCRNNTVYLSFFSSLIQKFGQNHLSSFPPFLSAPTTSLSLCVYICIYLYKEEAKGYMGRLPCGEKAQTNKGAWTREEDQLLINYIKAHGEGCWRSLPQAAGLLRCGKSCRLRWTNYLRPDLKRGNFTEEEEEIIVKLHSFLGNKWSLIAGRLPGRTDNEIKNYWNTHIKRKLISQGIDPQSHRTLNSFSAGNLKFELPNLISEDLSGRNTSSSKKRIVDSFDDGKFSSSSSSMTVEESPRPPHESVDQCESINLDLSIGLLTSHTNPGGQIKAATGLVSGNAAAAAATQSVSVCLCWRLGFRSGEFCSDCQPTTISATGSRGS